MRLYERLAARLIGTPLQRPAEWLRRLKGARDRHAHPELAELYREGERTQQVVRRVIRRDSCCIDIGCHIGAFLQTITSLAPTGRHHAFEPVPHKAAWLRRKFPGVTVHQIALGESNGSVEFFVDTARTAMSGFRTAAHGAAQALQVPCRRLDDVMIAPDANVGFIKLDVNGAELLVLRGAERLLLRDRPFVLLECTAGGLANHGIDPDDVIGFLQVRVGYRLYLLRDFLTGGPALDAAGLRASMTYPFEAFNFAAAPLEMMRDDRAPATNE